MSILFLKINHRMTKTFKNNKVLNLICLNNIMKKVMKTNLKMNMVTLMQKKKILSITISPKFLQGADFRG